MDINRILQLFEKQKTYDSDLDLLFNVVDECLLEGNYYQVDRLFGCLSNSYLKGSIENKDLTIGLLTVTNGAKHRLPERDFFVDKFKYHIKKEYGKQDAERLLQGLV